MNDVEQGNIFDRYNLQCILQCPENQVIHTWRDAVVVSILVATCLFEKSFTEVKRKNVATPTDAKTIHTHTNLLPLLAIPVLLRGFSVR